MIRKKSSICVNGEKITITSKPKDWKPLNDCGVGYNVGGYHVWINDTKFTKSYFSRSQCEKSAYKSWVKRKVNR